MICQQKIIEFYITNRKTYNHFLKFRCTIELSWNFFLKDTSAQVLLFSSKAPDVFLMSNLVVVVVLILFYFLNVT